MEKYVRARSGVPCPAPVTAATSVSRPVAPSSATNRAAARIGPTVCELDGPMPTENRSKTLIVTGTHPRRRRGRAPGQSDSAVCALYSAALSRLSAPVASTSNSQPDPYGSVPMTAGSATAAVFTAVTRPVTGA